MAFLSYHVFLRTLRETPMLRWVVKPRCGMNWESTLKIFRGGFEQRSIIISRASSPHGLFGRFFLGRCPRLIWACAFGAGGRRGNGPD